MQAKFVHAAGGGYSKIEVEHDGETLEFSGSVFQLAFKKGNYEPFQQINRYWKRQDKKWQDELFSYYLETKKIFNTVFQVNALILRLRPIMAKLIGMHDTEELERWARYHAGIWIPEDLDVEYTYSPDRPGSREQTYLVEDFWELAFMVLKLRSIVPVWGEFVEITKKESGPDFRDLNTYYTITKTSIEGSAAMTRLKHYVAKNIKQEDFSIRSSINGIGSDVFQTNLAANILVRILVVASLTREPAQTHLVQIVHKTLRNRLSQNESHQNAILEKVNPNEGDDGEDSSSRAEKYKNKPLVAPGDFTAIEAWTEYTREITARLLKKDNLSREEVAGLNEALDCAEQMDTHVVEECQLHLIRWVISPIVSCRALWDINKFSILRLAGITQYVLWNTGFKDLAGIATARSMNAEGYGSYGSESRAHIPKDLVEKINQLFPFYKRHPLKKTVKPVNDAFDEIMALSQALSEHTWFLNLPDQQLAELRGSAANKTYRVGYDIRIRLAELAIFTQERNESFLELYRF